MNKTLTLINLLLVLILVTVSPKTAQAETYILKAAQTMEVGTVEVSNTLDELTITYNITALNWGIAETHLHAATNPNDIPQTKKHNPIPGKFDPNTCADHNPPVTTYTYTIPGSFSPGQSLFIAAHAALIKETVKNGKTIIEEETAWADGVDFAGKNWATYIEYQVALPDLVVSGITLGTIANGILNYTYTIANIGGEGPAGPGPVFDAITYLSTDDTLDIGDTELPGSYSTWNYHLAEGWSQSRSESVALEPGDYYLIVMADAGIYWPGVTEANEQNNWTASAMFNVPEYLPDLVVSDTNIEISGLGDITYTYEVANIGGEGPFGNSHFDVVTYFSNDDTLDANDTMITSTYSAYSFHLSEGWSYSQTKTILARNLVRDLPPGDYYLITVADAFPGGQYPGVEEANENNNWTATMFTIPEDSAYNPDLVVSEIILNSITPNVVDYTFTIANIGEEGPIGYGPAFAVATFISTDDTFDSSDTSLPEGYSVWSYHLWVGWSESRYEPDTSLAGTPPGDYYLIVVADLKSNQPGVDETNEDNNWSALPITVPEP